MMIFLSPQVKDEEIIYRFKDEVIVVTCGHLEEEFNFSGLGDGELELTNPDTGEPLVKTALPVMPILSARKEDGVLWVELLNWISKDSRHEEKFPEWIDAKDYSSPKKASNIKTDKLQVSDLSKDGAFNENSSTEGNDLEGWGDF